MPWEADSPRRKRLPVDWPFIRARILSRDGYRCQMVWQGKVCGWKATDVDHIVPNDDDSETNLRSLCSWHHKRVTAAQGNTARWTPDTAHATRQPEQHPGMA